MNRKIWMVALALWFLLYALLSLTNVRFEAQNLVMGILVLAVALLLFLDR